MTAKPELIAPAGNLECARAAVANGADAVYFGLPRFNARMRADNFTAAELPALVDFLHAHRVRAFAVLNTLVFTGELADAEQELITLDQAGVDAVIVQDLGIAWLARELGLQLEVHASTQMTITSAEGLRFVAALGIKRVVMARELSLRELAKCRADGLPGLEVFVHGALCIAYSGQCLTSEALGQRSANRGECAQACRLPYELVVDGTPKDLGDRRYLLSPQDLAAVREIPELISLGVAGFKIEGRLKSPEYVAATTAVYRKAIDATVGRARRSRPWSRPWSRPADATYCASAPQPAPASAPTAADWYNLEMTFSRGLYPGWLHGVNHQKLVHARFGTKRGPFVGFITQVASDHVAVALQTPVKPGDGVVFDTGGDTDHEQGGRIWQAPDNRLYFERGHIDFRKLQPGHRVWKTSDPQIERALRRTFQGEIPRPKTPLDLTITGTVGTPLVITAQIAARPERVWSTAFRRNPDLAHSDVPPEGGTPNASALAESPTSWSVTSSIPLQAAIKHPLTDAVLRRQLGRLGETDFALGELHNHLVGDVILPVSELNRLRRELVAKLAEQYRRETAPLDRLCAGLRPRTGATAPQRGLLDCVEGETCGRAECGVGDPRTTGDDPEPPAQPELVVLCRTLEQVSAALATGCASIYIDLEDPRRYTDVVALVRQQPPAPDSPPSTLRSPLSALRPAVFLATPRIQKAGEQGFFKLIEQAEPDGVLVRNLGALEYFRDRPLRRIGDFSLNVANPLTAALLHREGLERLTISYDLNAQQVLDLLNAAPPAWFELTIHQHLPLFHMDHCVFAAFLTTNGTDATNCGRPCDRHNLKLRDRVGLDHPIQADVGCRNTVYHARAQSGAEFLPAFRAAGAQVFRVELLEEDAAQARLILASYQQLLAGSVAEPSALLRRLHAANQLGVTSGTLTVLG